jgi:hypothetical protein
MLYVYVCNLYRFANSPILPDKAYPSFEMLLKSLHAEYQNNFQYNGSTYFNANNECIISADDLREFVFVAKRMPFQI